MNFSKIVADASPSLPGKSGGQRGAVSPASSPHYSRKAGVVVAMSCHFAHGGKITKVRRPWYVRRLVSVVVIRVSQSRRLSDLSSLRRELKAGGHSGIVADNTAT